MEAAREKMEVMPMSADCGGWRTGIVSAPTQRASTSGSDRLDGELRYRYLDESSSVYYVPEDLRVA